jgi:hypothetical protein
VKFYLISNDTKLTSNLWNSISPKKMNFKIRNFNYNFTQNSLSPTQYVWTIEF